MKYINILYTGYRINNYLLLFRPPPPLTPIDPPAMSSSLFTQIHLSITVIVIYCTLACSHFHVMFDDAIVYNSCTHISCSVDIILPN